MQCKNYSDFISLFVNSKLITIIVGFDSKIVGMTILTYDFVKFVAQMFTLGN